MNDLKSSKLDNSAFGGTSFLPIFAAVAAIACGAGVIGLGGGSSSATVAMAATAFLLIGTVIWILLDLPVITFVRFLFAASFFLKLEINLFKLDEIEDPSGFNFSLAVFCALILLFHDLVFEEQSKNKRRFPFIFWTIVGGLLFFAAASVFYSDVGGLGYYSLWTLSGSVLITAAVAAHFADRERLVELLTGIAAGILVTGVVAITQFAFDFPSNLPFFGTGTEEERISTQTELFSRAQAFLRTPTEMGWVVSSLLPLIIIPLLSRIKQNGIKHRRILFAAAALGGVSAIILSLARGSWIGLIVGAVVIVGGSWWNLTKTERKNYFLMTGGMLLLGAVVLAPLSGRIYERLSQDDEGSAAIRLPLLEVAGRIIEDNPLVGIGINNYRAAMVRYDDTGMFVSQVFPNPVHNVFAHITAEIGIPGGILFIFLILTAIAVNLRTLSGSAGDKLRFALALALIAGLLAWIVSAMKEPSSLGSVRPPIRTLFLLFGITLAVNRMPSIIKNERKPFSDSLTESERARDYPALTNTKRRRQL